MRKNLTKFLILTIVFSAALSVNYLFAAWVGPTQAPPGGNTSTPIHVGSTNQVKDGGLSVNALSVFGNGWFQGGLDVGGKIKVGNDAVAPDAGEIRWTGTDLEVYNGSAWASLTGGEVAPAADPDYTDCINVGGSWVDAQGVCYFSNTSCPSGWSQKQNYNTTIPNTCSTTIRECLSSCTTGGHVRENKYESCTYQRTRSLKAGRQQRTECRAYGELLGCTAIRIEIGCEKN